MDFTDIETILALMREHDLAEFELERDGLKLRVRKAGVPPTFHATPIPTIPVIAGGVPAAPSAAVVPPAAPAPPAPAAGAEEEESLELAVVKSPIVGTFYRAPEPGAPSFVEVGQRVKKDQVLCIIEAMKLMNEIDSEYDGEIANIYVENGQPVQYGERLFAIKTA
jgi:acetyl-CoA carboxylase biotin carboxyl carrier protein